MSLVTKVTPKKLDAFCLELEKSGNVTAACDAASMSRMHAYRLKAKNKEFAKRWEDAYERCLDRVEAALVTRGTIGWDEPVFHQGVECGVKPKFSDTAAMFILNGRRPSVFKRFEDPQEVAESTDFVLTVRRKAVTP